MQCNLAEKLPHLPPEKVQRLKHAVDLILEDQEVEMIILYGSYARGDYKETRIEEVGGYKVRFRSDYDLLLVSEHPRSRVEFVPDPHYSPPRPLTGPPHELQREMFERDDAIQMTMIDIETLNHNISEHHSFYIDIYREGIILYNSGRYELEPPPKELSPELRWQFAVEEFGGWFEDGKNCIETTEFQVSKRMYSRAAFMLEQAYESFYRAVIMVFTHYNPHEHNLYSLRYDAEQHAPTLKAVFPIDTQEHKKSFERLHLAYIQARYFKGYKVDVDELHYWHTEAKKLCAAVEVVGRKKIESLRLLTQ